MTDQTTNSIEIRDMRGAPWFWMHSSIIREYGAKLGPYGIAVYCALAVGADHSSGQTWPSLATIADTTGMSERKARQVIRELEALGLIDTENRYENGSQRSSIYTLLKPPHEGGAAQHSPLGRHVVPGGAARGADKQDPLNKKERTTTTTDRSQPEHDLRRPLPLPEGARAGSGGETFKLFEDVFGYMPSLFVMSTADDLVEEYGYKAVANAFKIAATANKKDLRYVKGILRRDPSGGVQQPRSDGPKSAFWRPEEDAHDPAA